MPETPDHPAAHWHSRWRRAAAHPLRRPADASEWLAERRWDICVDAIMTGQATTPQASAWLAAQPLCDGAFAP